MTLPPPDGESLPLFDDAPVPTPPPATATTLAASIQPAGGPDARARLAFKRLVEQVDEARAELAAWQAAIERYRTRAAAELEPLHAELRASQRQMVFLLDGLVAGTRPAAVGLGRVQRGKLQRLLLDLLVALLESDADPALVALHDRHAGVTHAEARAAELAETRDMLEATFGIDLGQAQAAATADELMAQAAERLREQLAREQAAGDARRQARARKAGGAAATETARSKREAQAADASRSVRDVYRQLASALHPDRETDPAERERKTQQMQRVNDAYAKKDLLVLLEVQLEVEAFDPRRLAGLPQERLGHYSRALRDQLKALAAEIAACRAPFVEDGSGFAFAVGRPPRAPGVSAATLVDRLIDADLAELHATLHELANDRVAFEDPRRLREALRRAPGGNPVPARLDDAEEIQAGAWPAQKGPGAGSRGNTSRSRRRG